MSRLQDKTAFTDTVIDDLDFFWINENQTSTATLSIASPCVVTKTAHGLEVGNKISFTTSGALPTGITASTDYYIISTGFGANSFQISATANGTAINTSGTQSGTHTYSSYVSKKMSGLKLKALLTSDSSVQTVVLFDQNTPTTGGVIFTPDTPATTGILYISTTNNSTWKYASGTYSTYALPVVASTPFLFDGTTIDAGSNKTGAIMRSGNIKVKHASTNEGTTVYSYGLTSSANGYTQHAQYSYNDSLYPLLIFARKRGTIASPTNTQAGDILGQIYAGGGFGTCADITFRATENIVGTSNSGGEIVFSTTENATTYVTSPRVKIKNNGKMSIESEASSTIASFNASKELTSLGTATYPSLTELTYVKGVTSAIQTQINSKASQDARVQTVTSSATVTPVSTNDLVIITAQAVGLTLANPTGTFTEGQALMIRIKDNATARSIAFDTNYRAIGVTLPTTTVISKTLYLGIIYNATDGKWDIVGYNLQA